MKEINHRDHRDEVIEKISLCSPQGYPMQEITKGIISYCIEVHSIFGMGLLESVYEEALNREFELRGIKYERQKAISLKYKGKEIGQHRIDFLWYGKV